MSFTSKQGGGSRSSDEDGKTAVKVGEYHVKFCQSLAGPFGMQKRACHAILSSTDTLSTAQLFESGLH